MAMGFKSIEHSGGGSGRLLRLYEGLDAPMGLPGSIRSTRLAIMSSLASNGIYDGSIWGAISDRRDNCIPGRLSLISLL
jgi:hypothetical protein